MKPLVIFTIALMSATLVGVISLPAIVTFILGANALLGVVLIAMASEMN